MSKEIFVFFSGIVAVVLYLTTQWFRHSIKIGKPLRRSIFITTVTILMAICGLAIGLAINSGPLLIVILTLSIGAIGAEISLIIILALYKKK